MGRTSRGDNKSKQKRQQTILRLIQENPTSRQETLLEYLSKEGFDADSRRPSPAISGR